MVGVDVVARDGAVHAVDQRAQATQVGRRRLLRDAPAGVLVEHRAQLVDLVCFLDGDLAHEHAAVLLEADEAGLLERAERLAHRAARYAEQVGDRRLVQLAAGGKLAGEDAPLEFALHQRGERVGLQHRDRAFGRAVARLRARPWHLRAGRRRACVVFGFQHVAIRRFGV